MSNIIDDVISQNREPFMSHGVVINKDYNLPGNKIIVWQIDPHTRERSKIAIDSMAEFRPGLHEKIEQSLPEAVVERDPIVNDEPDDVVTDTKERFDELSSRGWKNLKGAERPEYIRLKKIYG